MKGLFSGNDGYNIIELIMGLFIFSLVGLMASSFYHRVGSLEKEIIMRESINQDMVILSEKIKKDMKYLKHDHLNNPGIEISQPHCTGDLCRKINLERVDSSGSDIDVTYENRCVDAQGIFDLNSGLAREDVLEKSFCLKAANCSGRELPEVWTVLNQSDPDSQESKVFRHKLNSKNPSTTYIASAVCFERIDIDQGQVKMTVEAVYKYNGKLKFMSSSHYLTPSLIGQRVEILP